MPITPATPQPFRDGSPRDAWEQESWDDHVNVIFGIHAATLSIPMRVTGRIEIMAQGLLAAAGILTVSVNGIAITPTGVTNGAESAHVLTYYDVPTPGNYVITIAATVGLSEYSIVARRGRKPPP